ncbi:MAG: ACT domain-containing protein [Acidiferrobacterales bacterium]
MAQKTRKIDYFTMDISNRPGKAAEILEMLRMARVNLLGFTGFPRGTRGQLDFIPEDTALFAATARRAQWALKKKKTGFMVQGDDRPGAIGSVLSRLAGAGINVTAIDAVCAGKGRFGALLWVKEKDVRKAAKALGAS